MKKPEAGMTIESLCNYLEGEVMVTDPDDHKAMQEQLLYLINIVRGMSRSPDLR